MQSTLSKTTADTVIAAVITSHGPNGQTAVRCLYPGESLVVGSGSACDLQLSGQGVAETHCTLTAKGNSVHVRDHKTAAGTLLDNERVTDVRLRSDTKLIVGDHVVALMLGGESDADVDVTVVPCTSRPATQESPSEAVTSNVRDEADDAFLSFDELQQLRHELQDAHMELDVLRERLECADIVAADNDDTFKDDMIELLRSEVVELQTALAVRDEAGGESMADADADRDVLSREESEQLVDRLERLLLDLQERDQQVALLDGLLDAAEQANHAERQEREQLDEWVGDIESRFGEREQEWSAERDALKQQIVQLTEQRNRAEADTGTENSDARVESLKRLVATLREESSSLQSQLEESRRTCTELRRELAEADGAASREEIVQIARERAELARMRHEIEERSRDLTQGGSVDESIQRLQTLRQHLNEVHAREEQQRRERSLSGRIAKLWKSLDGK